MPSADPRDLAGTWMHTNRLVFRIQTDMYGNKLPYNEKGAKVLARRVNSLGEGTPFINASALCRPPGQQWQLDLNMPFHIFPSKKWIEFYFEEYHNVWNILLDPDAGNGADEKRYMGKSVGHWVGDTLVVETSGFRQGLWLDTNGTPMSASAKMTQRIRKVDNGDGAPFLDVVTTIDDPTYYTRPWSIVRAYSWRPDRVVLKEYNCEEQVGDPGGGPDPGLVPEPAA